MASDYLEEQLGTHLLRTASFPKPTTIYVALFTVMPADDGTGGTEVTGGSYARVLHGPDDAKWAAPTGGNGQFSNASAVTYATPTANWGTVVGFGLYDASSAGQYLGGATLSASRTIASGDPAPNFPTGALKVTFS